MPKAKAKAAADAAKPSTVLPKKDVEPTDYPSASGLSRKGVAEADQASAPALSGTFQHEIGQELNVRGSKFTSVGWKDKVALIKPVDKAGKYEAFQWVSNKVAGIGFVTVEFAGVQSRTRNVVWMTPKLGVLLIEGKEVACASTSIVHLEVEDLMLLRQPGENAHPPLIEGALPSKGN